MRVFAVALALSVVLMGAPSFAEALAQQAPAAQGQKPAAPAPAQPAPAQPAAAPPAAVRPPFQTGLKYAYVNLQEIVATSNEGKGLTAKMQAFQDQKVKELQDKQKALQSAQEKLEKGATVMSDQARAQLQADIERQQRDIQRATEDAQQEVQRLQQQVEQEFYRRLTPVIDKVAREKQVHFVFDAQASGLVWADPTMDLTPDVIKAFDAGAAAKPAAAAPPPAPVPVKP